MIHVNIGLIRCLLDLIMASSSIQWGLRPTREKSTKKTSVFSALVFFVLVAASMKATHISYGVPLPARHW